MREGETNPTSKTNESLSLAIIWGELKDDYREVLRAFWNGSELCDNKVMVPSHLCCSFH